jgi:hypothetical protein
MYIVCPLEFERRSLAPLARARGWTLVRTGPGTAGMDRWARGADLPPAGARVILAGLAGATAPLSPDRAIRVGTVADQEGNEWTAPGVPEPDRAFRCLCVSHVLANPEAKDRAARQWRVDIADMESAPFARLATARGWDWAVVRGISDGVDETLPEGIEGWTDADGCTRLWKVIASILRAPTLLPRLRVLRDRSRRAMRAVAAALDRLEPAPQRAVRPTAP